MKVDLLALDRARIKRWREEDQADLAAAKSALSDAEATILYAQARQDELRAELEEAHKIYVANIKAEYEMRITTEARNHVLEKTLSQIEANAKDWHGPPTSTGHVRALAVIASWCHIALSESSSPHQHRFIARHLLWESPLYVCECGLVDDDSARRYTSAEQ